MRRRIRVDGLAAAALFGALTLASAATAAEWQPNTFYAVGAVVTYQGPDYQCIQAHTSQVGWEPPNAPALWRLQSTATPTATATRTATPCACGYTPTATFTPIPTARPSVTPTSTSTATATATATATTTATPRSTPWSTGYLDISISKVDPQVGQTVTVTGSGNTGNGSWGLQVIDVATGQVQDPANPILTPAQPPGASFSGTSYSWTLTAARTGSVTFKMSVYGETLNGCTSCFAYATNAAMSSAISVRSNVSPTPTPAPQGYGSVSVWRSTAVSIGGSVIVRGKTNLGVPAWNIKVIDASTGLEQDELNPIFTPARPPGSGGGAGAAYSWTLTAARPGTVRFQVLPSGEAQGCGGTCWLFMTVPATSIPITAQ